MSEPKRSQFVKFSFFKLTKEWRQLGDEEKAVARKELSGTLEDWADSPERILRGYTTVGIRPDADFMLWQISFDIEDQIELGESIRRTAAGPYLDEPYGYLAMTRRSMYIEEHSHPGQEGSRLEVVPGEAKFLFVYPFVKTHEWYMEDMASRQKMMDEHIKIGHKYPGVKIHTTYSYGLDDQEFVLAFEGDDPVEFMDLVMELRHSAARPYTERDVPIFTCVARSLSELI